jgi:hypothetical protein
MGSAGLDGRAVGSAISRLAAVICVLFAIATGACGGSSDLKLDARLQAVTASHVGGQDGFTLTVQNQDTDIQNLVLFLANGHDNWLDHHVILNSGGCTIDKQLHGLKCGPLKAGKSARPLPDGGPQPAHHPLPRRRLAAARAPLAGVPLVAGGAGAGEVQAVAESWRPGRWLATPDDHLSICSYERAGRGEVR